MRSKLTEQGVTLPRQWFRGATEVDIQRENGQVIVVPVGKDDPTTKLDEKKLDEKLRLGKNPIEIEVDDAAAEHDRYLYDQ